MLHIRKPNAFRSITKALVPCRQFSLFATPANVQKEDPQPFTPSAVNSVEEGQAELKNGVKFIRKHNTTRYWKLALDAHKTLLQEHDKNPTSFPLSESVFAAGIRATTTIRRPSEGSAIFSKMSTQYDIKPTILTYNDLLLCRGLSNDISGMKETLENIEQQNLDTINTWTFLVRSLGENGKTLEAEDAYRELRKKFVPQPYSVSAMIAAYGVGGDLGKAFKLFHKYKRKRLPGQRVCLSLMEACLRNGKTERVFEAFDLQTNISKRSSWTRKPNQEAYHLLIQACGLSDQIERAIKIRDVKMPAEDVPVTRDTWLALIRACALAKDPEYASALYHQMLSKGMHSGSDVLSLVLQAIANAIPYAHTYLDGPTKPQEDEQYIKQLTAHAEDLYQHILALTDHPEVQVLSSMMEVYGKRGNIKQAHEIFNDWNQKDLFVDRQTLSNFMAHTSIWGELPLVESVFQNIKEREGMELELEDYFAVLRVALREEQKEKAKEWLDVIENEQTVGLPEDWKQEIEVLL